LVALAVVPARVPRALVGAFGVLRYPGRGVVTILTPEASPSRHFRRVRVCLPMLSNRYLSVIESLSKERMGDLGDSGNLSRTLMEQRRACHPPSSV